MGILGTLARFCDEASQAICQKGSASLIQTINAKIQDVKLMKKASVHQFPNFFLIFSFLKKALMEYLLYLQRNSDLITQNKGIDALNLLLDKHTKDDEIDLAVRLYIYLYIIYLNLLIFNRASNLSPVSPFHRKTIANCA